MNENFEKIFELETEEGLKEVVSFLCDRLKPGDFIRLEGPLGVGKTTFVRAFLRSFGWKDSVPSPTYPILIEYDLPEFRVIHIDAFRLDPSLKLEEPWDIAEWKDAVVFIEWPEKTRIPPDRFKGSLKFSFQNESEQSEERSILFRSSAS